MKRTVVSSLVLIALLQIVAAGTANQKPADCIDSLNVVWNSPSENSHGSMPLGNGDVGINAWVERNGDLVFYVSKTDAWDENGRLCKIGRVRVKFDPALVVTNGFRQELKLRNGVIEIKAEGGNLKPERSISQNPDSSFKSHPSSLIRLWVDANQPVVRMESESPLPVNCRAEIELWRLRERPFGGDDDGHSGGGLSGSAFKPTVLPDVVVPAEKSRVAWYHRNTRSIFGLVLQVQHLEALKDRFPDQLLNHTFGASISGEGLIRAGDRAIKSEKACKQHQLSICVLAERAATPEAWLKDLGRIECSVSSFKKSLKVTSQWWQAFWDRSWVFVDGSKELSDLTRGYVLQRFMNACSGRGNSPIKFNGSIFSVEPNPSANPESTAGDPDWRRWGGNYWFQNTRHCYWSMFGAGDFDLMKPFFKMYVAALPLGKARMQSYYKFENAAQFPETMYFWGLPNNNDYGWNNTAPEPGNGYIKRYWSGSLELTAMMLDYYDYTQDREFARTTLIPLADPLIAFLDNYWQKRNANGKRVFDPAQSLETYHVAVNPLPEIAGLNFVLPRLLALPKGLTTEEQRAHWTKLLGELPPIPSAEVNGVRVFRPADSFSGASNSENPELYGVFPFRLFGVGRDSLEMSRKTYDMRHYRHNTCWCQDSIQAACLGLGDEAGKLVVARAARVNPVERFPVMWGPHNDWTPDQDHGNPILTTLHYMLLQYSGDKIYLFPAWPKTWSAAFKLHAPKNTIVEGEIRDGKLISLKVTPKSRTFDIVNMIEK